MKQMTVTAKDPKSGREASITVNTGETAKEMIEMFGDEAVASNANANWVVTLQAGIRNALKRGETAEQIQTRLGTAKMGVKVVGGGGRVDPVQAYLAMFQNATPEKQAEMLKELQKKASKK